MPVVITNPTTKETISYYLDPKLIKFAERKIKEKISKKDKDYVMIVDGYEGAGKSTWAMQIGKYVDPSLDISRVCMTANEFRQAILDADKAQCVIYDEAVTGMTAADSIARVGKLLKSLMMQMRQKNLFVIVILPSIFEFNRYAVLARARSFFHIYEKGSKMGYWVGYNRKDMRLVYLKGKKDYAYKVKSRFHGIFRGKCPINEEEYRQKKSDALELIDVQEEPLGKIDKNAQRDYLLWIIRQETGYSEHKMAELLEKYKYPLSHGLIGEVLTKIKEKGLPKVPISPLRGIKRSEKREKPTFQTKEDLK